MKGMKSFRNWITRSKRESHPLIGLLMYIFAPLLHPIKKRIPELLERVAIIDSNRKLLKKNTRLLHLIGNEVPPTPRVVILSPETTGSFGVRIVVHSGR